MQYVDHYTQVPDGLLDVAATDLKSCLQRPSIIELSGESDQYIFVSALLHGNEHSSLSIVQNLIKRYQGKKLPRGLILFVGNIEAAAANQRFLPGQPDYNRIWHKSDIAAATNDAERMAAEVITFARSKNVWVSIDIHNNTGLNPHYACINRLEENFVKLAGLYTPTVVYFQEPASAKSVAFSKFTTALTIECGKSADPTGIEHTTDFLDTCMRLESIDHSGVHQNDISIYYSYLRMKLPDGASVAFADRATAADLTLLDSIEKLNFAICEKDTLLGYSAKERPFVLLQESGDDCFDSYFKWKNGEIRFRQKSVPAMLTKDKDVIRDDCIGYLMKEVQASDVGNGNS